MQTLKETLDELPERISVVRLIRTNGTFIERCSVQEATQRYGDWTYHSGYSEGNGEISLWINNTK